MARRCIINLLLILWFAGGCFEANFNNSFSLSQSATTGTPSQIESTVPTASPVYPWSDENEVMNGICFEAALAAVGQIFVLRDTTDHIQFYNATDGKKLCRHPVTRYSFDFGGGRVLAGLWSTGTGCKARHDVLSVMRDDNARTLVIRLHFVTEGTCNYELVRPFWIGLDGVQNYDIHIEVE